MTDTSKTLKPVRSIECACCGSRTLGRQWWNQDTGYGGPCLQCIERCRRGVASDAEMERTYGKAGVHYNVGPADIADAQARGLYWDEGR